MQLNTVNIIFNFKKDEDFLYIDLINDGLPFPDNITFQDFIKIGTRSKNSKGGGIGGYLMNLVVQNHNGIFERISTKDTFTIIPLEENKDNRSLSITPGLHLKVKIPLQIN